MVSQNSSRGNSNFNTECAFGNAIKELKISQLLKASNITKARGASAYEVFQFLLIMVFQRCNLYHFLNSKKKDTACDDNTYYRFLNEGRFNWKKFILLLSTRVAAYMSTLTSRDRVKYLVLDDSVIARNRAKKVELLSTVFNHVIGKCERGFNLLLLGWTDGYSFLPVQYNMLASAKQENRYNEAKTIHGSHRSNAYIRRQDAVETKPEAALKLIKAALSTGIEADYILMDTWFTTEPFIAKIKELNLDTIGMLKDCKQEYWYNGKLCKLKALAARVNMSSTGELFGSIVVKTKKQKLAVKLVFVRNRNKQSDYIVILSTDTTLADSEIVRTYGNRWNIELCFRACKSLLCLGSEYQGLNYDMTESTTAIVLCRFIILEYLRRKNSDPKTICELFYVCCDDIQDMDLTTALKSIMSIFAEGLKTGDIKISSAMSARLLDWYVSQPNFIKVLFPTFPEQLQVPENQTVA